MIKFFNKSIYRFIAKDKISLGRNPNCIQKWIVAACAPPYFCIIKNDLVNGRS